MVYREDGSIGKSSCSRHLAHINRFLVRDAKQLQRYYEPRNLEYDGVLTSF